eukprot:TRINITY_DN18144_c0_g1_i1.p1 TRINITY_DN18144_c0_g1~~TRINITY_DN18144_c0_g1_i1.p1  ORF type:complete len:186 (-),score=58.54 TRINITY_DN18144_c0_g1_i1:123-680(-)
MRAAWERAKRQLPRVDKRVQEYATYAVIAVLTVAVVVFMIIYCSMAVYQVNHAKCYVREDSLVIDTSGNATAKGFPVSVRFELGCRSPLNSGITLQVNNGKFTLLLNSTSIGLVKFSHLLVASKGKTETSQVSVNGNLTAAPQDGDLVTVTLHDISYNLWGKVRNPGSFTQTLTLHTPAFFSSQA